MARHQVRCLVADFAGRFQRPWHDRDVVDTTTPPSSRAGAVDADETNDRWLDYSGSRIFLRVQRHFLLQPVLQTCLRLFAGRCAPAGNQHARAVASWGRLLEIGCDALPSNSPAPESKTDRVPYALVRVRKNVVGGEHGRLCADYWRTENHDRQWPGDLQPSHRSCRRPNASCGSRRP